MVVLLVWFVLSLMILFGLLTVVVCLYDAVCVFCGDLVFVVIWVG